MSQEAEDLKLRLREDIEAASELSEEKREEIYNVIGRNFTTLVELRKKKQDQRSVTLRVSDWITEFSGSIPFLTLHVIWFGSWIVLNFCPHEGVNLLGFHAFDPFPYGLLTMVVSLEAIFLATFVLISQNRMSQEADERADLDLQINLLSENEITRVIKMLDAIHKKLGIDDTGDEQLLAFEQEVTPEKILNVIRKQADPPSNHKAPKRKTP